MSQVETSNLPTLEIVDLDGSSCYLVWILDYVGSDDWTYTDGIFSSEDRALTYFHECVSDKPHEWSRDGNRLTTPASDDGQYVIHPEPIDYTFWNHLVHRAITEPHLT